MSKQYTFKTTRYTEWMEEILDNISNQDRSRFIREVLIQGMKSMGIKIQEETQRSFVLQTTDQPVTNISQIKVTQRTEETLSPMDLDIPVMDEEISLEELEQKLDLIGGSI